MAKDKSNTGRGKSGWVAPRTGGYTPKVTSGTARGNPPTGRASSSSAVAIVRAPATTASARA
jgi:hypothetical protein